MVYDEKDECLFDESLAIYAWDTLDRWASLRVEKSYKTKTVELYLQNHKGKSR